MEATVSNAKRRGIAVNRHIVIFVMFLSAFLVGESCFAQNVSANGNPLPRFVSISATEANMRSGPGRQYPIHWVFKRKYLPIEVIDEHGPWRKVKDHEGAIGWIHRALLSPRRTVIMLDGTKSLFRDNNRQSAVTLTAGKGVIGQVLECSGTWCRLEIQNTKGWIERHHLWGVYSHEEIQ